MKMKKAEPGRSSVHVNKPVEKSPLTTDERNDLHDSTFALPKERKYPINDISHARNALARVSQHGTDEEKAKVKSAVYRKFPSLKPIAKGGPGSGVSGDNTEKIAMPHSPYTSVGTRKGMLDNMEYTEESITMDSITHVGQEKFVPRKLEKMVSNWDKVKDKPIDVLKVGDEYHVIDGHHRYLAAKEIGEDQIQARVRVKAVQKQKVLEGGGLNGQDTGTNAMDGIYSMAQIVSGIDWELGGSGLSDVNDARAQALDNLSDDPDFYRKKRLMAGNSPEMTMKDTEEGQTNPMDGLGLTPGLHLDMGSGQCREPGYLGVDVYKFDHGTVVDDLELGLPWVDDQTCEKIRMANVPELSPMSETMMNTVQRILMPDGEFVYEGPGEIESLPPYMQMTKKEKVDKGVDNIWTKQTFKKGAIPDAATSDDTEPRIGVAQYDMLPADALLAMDAADYGWSDATSSGRGNRVHGYPSQGALLNKELPNFLGDDNTGAVSKIYPIFKADQYKQIIYCVVITPDECDLQDDIMSAEDIEKTAHEYLIDARVVGSSHSKQMNADVVESYIAPIDFNTDGQLGPQNIKKGSWIIGIKVNDSREWQKVLSGEYTGVSLGGLGSRVPI